MEFENVLLVTQEVFLYQLPPRQSNRGYRASELDLNKYLWKGRLRLVSTGKNAVLRLEDGSTGQLYAKCPIDAFPGIAVEPVTDSSRFFVIRLMADDGRTGFLFMGFTERSDSFDFKLAIQDHFKLLKREKEVVKQQLSQPLDLSFKEGERITLNLNIARPTQDSSGTASTPKASLATAAGQRNFTGGLLPPPPAPAKSRVRGNRAVHSVTAPAAGKTSTANYNNNPEGSNLDKLLTLDGSWMT